MENFKTISKSNQTNKSKINEEINNILEIKVYEFDKVNESIKNIVYKYDSETSKKIIEEFINKGKTNIGYLGIIANIAKEGYIANKKDIVNYIIEKTLEIILNDKGANSWIFSVYLLEKLLRTTKFSKEQIEDLSKFFYKKLNTKKDTIWHTTVFPLYKINRNDDIEKIKDKLYLIKKQ